MSDFEHIHSHRNLIGFDEHGVPTVTLRASQHHHDAYDSDASEGLSEETEQERLAFVQDYMNAVAAYRKTFPNTDEVLEQTPDPAVREMILRQKQLGIDTTFDRFDKQQPQCSFGLAGVCCRICHMGPCHISTKAEKGICGADADLIVARNLLRAAAAGAAQHGMHGRELMLELKWAAEGKLKIPLLGKQKIIATAAAFGIPTEGCSIEEVAGKVAAQLLSDLSNPDPEQEYRTLRCLAPPERVKIWDQLNLIPISAYHEVFEAYHKSAVGTDGDWRSVMQQLLRCGLAFTFSGVVGTSVATDCLFGVGDRVTSKVNIGALEKGYVNIAVHGHYPLLVKEMVKAGQKPALQELARAKGAKGIRFYGICCSGLSAMYRYAGVIPLSNAVSAELVLATGALDLWVADVQDVFPAIMDVARCFQTVVVTTSDSARLPGAERFELDHRHSNIGEVDMLAEKIVHRAIESHEARGGIPVQIPPYEVEAEVGFSVEYLFHRFGGFGPVAEALKKGQIRGIVNMVGCNNPKVPFERCIADVAKTLIENNVLILSNGCASYPLMKLGYCSSAGAELAGGALREFLGEDLPPVWHVGECIDNTRSSGIMSGIAAELGIEISRMPFAFSSPEWSNEKGLDAALGFRLLGISSYHCVEAPVWGSKNVIEFLKEGTKETLGSCMVVDVDPVKLGNQIISDMKTCRRALGWPA